MNQQNQQRGPILIVYTNDIFDLDEDRFVQALVLSHTFPLLTNDVADQAEEVLLQFYDVPAYDYLSPEDLQGIRMADMVGPHNVLAREEFVNVLDTVRPRVCLLVGNRVARAVNHNPYDGPTDSWRRCNWWQKIVK